MPLTPFHLGPSLFFGLLLFPYIDLSSVLIASVIIDVEPLLVLILNLNYPLHGFFHSLIGGTLLACILTISISQIPAFLMPLLSFLQVGQQSSVYSILLSTVFGIYLHILLDSRTHRDIRPFYPLTWNPFLSRSRSSVKEVYILCIWLFLGGLFMYGIRLILF